MPFAFQLGQTVTKSDGYTTAKVIGRAEFNYCENRYQVLRQDGDKTSAEWWDEGGIKKTNPATSIALGPSARR
jgi:hypothetical protein